MQRLHLLLLLLLSCCCCCLAQQDSCTEEEREEAARDHSRCIETVEERARTGSGSLAGGRISTLCARLEEQVHRCGEHLGRCMTANDLRVIKDAQIHAFTKYLDAQRLGHLYRDCEIVQEYKRSGRRPYKATSRCSRDEVGEVLEKREECVLREKLAMGSKMKRISRTDRAGQTEVICEFVEKTMHDCTKEMEECYSDDEFDTMREQSYNALAKILRRLDVNFRLTDCSLPTEKPLPTPVPQSGSPGAPAAGSSLILLPLLLWILLR